MKTMMVREIKIVDRGGGDLNMAFYRFVESRSPVWYSMPLNVALRAIQNGRGSWNGVDGPVVELKPTTERIDMTTGQYVQTWDH